MPAINTSTFVAQEHQTLSVDQDVDAINITGFAAFAHVGSGAGKFPVEHTKRRNAANAWHLGSPQAGLAIPKTAIIDKVRVKFVPASSRSTTGANANQSFKVLMPDGHWDRSRSHPLHQQQGAPTYGPPLVNASTEMRIFDESGVQIAESFANGLGNFFYNTNTNNFLHTAGCTLFVPANTEVGGVLFNIARLDSPGANPDTVVKAYELHGNARHFAIDSLIDTSDPIPYNSIQFFGGDNPPKWNFSTPLPAKPFGRWLGLFIEGDWFSEQYVNTHRLFVVAYKNDQQESYPAGSNGSLMMASNIAAAQYENSFVGLYYWTASFPALYEENNDIELELPFPRGFGRTMDWSGSDPLEWVDAVEIVYGDTVNDVADEPVTPPLLGEIQAFIRSDHYDPSTGRYWLGLMFDKKDGITLYSYNSPTSALAAITLELDWHVPLPELCSFPIEATPAVVSEKLKATPAVESFSVEAWPAVISEELESHLAVESFAITSEPAVQSFPLVINGEC